MATYLDIHPDNPQPRLIARAAAIISGGGLIAYPTDSCFALGCAFGNKEGMDRIRTIRRLDGSHDFTLVCRDFAQLGRYVMVGNRAFRSIKNATPGRYTFILPATKEVPRLMMNKKKHTVGVRIPQHRISHALVTELGEPILSSTLILPGADDPMTQGWQINDELGHLLDAVIDGESGDIATTVVDFSDERDVRITRRGAGDPAPFE